MQLQKNYSQKDIRYYDGDRTEMMDFVPESTKIALDVGCIRFIFAYD